MLALDSLVIQVLNPYAQASRVFDSVVVAMSHNGMFKAAPLLAMVWCFWFIRDERVNERRVRIVSVMGAALAAAAVSVILTRVLPARLRPMSDPELGFVLPYSMVAKGWESASSLPSDHASMFMALAVGMFTLSRRWGVVASTFALVFVLLPRAYVGLHYASDLLAGALIGIAFVALTSTALVRRTVSQRIVDFSATRPHVFYVLLFLLCEQITDLFKASREIGSMLYKLSFGHL